jgi:hypothetical protein
MPPTFLLGIARMVRSVAFLGSGRHGSFPSGFLQTRGACENSNREPLIGDNFKGQPILLTTGLLWRI